MSPISLEDFGTAAPMRRAAAPESVDTDPTPRAYETGYNAGWDDALAQIDQERSRIGESLAERLTQVEQTRDEVTAHVLRSLQPLLQDVFDKVLPRAVERGFLSVLLQEAETLLEESDAALTLLVAPEEVPGLETLLATRDDLQDVVSVKAEPALALSQAVLAWSGGQRRLDLQGVLTALDAAFEGFLERTPDPSSVKEAAHG